MPDSIAMGQELSNWTLLFFISEVVARILDRRRGLTKFDGLDDDQASDLDYDRDVIRYSGLDEDED